MKTQEDNAADGRGETADSKRNRERHYRDLRWARQWHEGHAQCPACGGIEFRLVHTHMDLATRYEVLRCKTRGCRTHWAVAFLESAVAVLREHGGEEDWIDLAGFDRPQRLYLSERESATLLAALRYWRREGPGSTGHERDIETDNDRLKPLSAEEVDVLCERLAALSRQESDEDESRT